MQGSHRQARRQTGQTLIWRAVMMTPGTSCCSWTPRPATLPRQARASGCGSVPRRWPSSSTRSAWTQLARRRLASTAPALLARRQTLPRRPRARRPCPPRPRAAAAAAGGERACSRPCDARLCRPDHSRANSRSAPIRGPMEQPPMAPGQALTSSPAAGRSHAPARHPAATRTALYLNWNLHMWLTVRPSNSVSPAQAARLVEPGEPSRDGMNRACVRWGGVRPRS
jgi:hypothetical protein